MVIFFLTCVSVCLGVFVLKISYQVRKYSLTHGVHVTISPLSIRRLKVIDPPRTFPYRRLIYIYIYIYIYIWGCSVFLSSIGCQMWCRTMVFDNYNCWTDVKGFTQVIFFTGQKWLIAKRCLKDEQWLQVSFGSSRPSGCGIKRRNIIL